MLFVITTKEKYIVVEKARETFFKKLLVHFFLFCNFTLRYISQFTNYILHRYVTNDKNYLFKSLPRYPLMACRKANDKKNIVSAYMQTLTRA